MSANWGDGEGMDTSAPSIPVPAVGAPAASNQSPTSGLRGAAPQQGGARTYKRLALSKRTVAAPAASAASASSRSSIFGAAKPREQVLKEKGIDVKAVERKLDERTQRLPRMNKSQEEEFQEIEKLLEASTKTAASEDASVDDKAAAQAEVEKLTKERAEFLEARKKEEIEFARKRREQIRAEQEAANASGAAPHGGHRDGGYGGRDGGYGGRDRNSGGSYGGNRDRNSGGSYGGDRGSPNRGGFDNNNGGDFSNFSSNRNRDRGSFGDRGGDRGAGRSFGGNDRGAGYGGRGGGFGGDRGGDRGRGGHGASDCKLFVGQLNFATTQDSLAEAFGKYGPLEECTVIFDRQTGQSRGYGFVNFKNAADAATALRELDGARVDGRPIIVKNSQ